MTAPHVRPPVARLTDDDARASLSTVINKLCEEHGPSRVALEVGCDEKTIRRAREKESTLKLHTAGNLLALSPYALDGFLGRYGFRAVPIGSRCDTDVLLATSASVHSICGARDPNSPGGVIETSAEKLAQEAGLRKARAAIDERLAEIEAIRRAA